MTDTMTLILFLGIIAIIPVFLGWRKRVEERERAKGWILASAKDFDSIRQAVEDFYLGERKLLLAVNEEATEWAVHNATGNNTVALPGVRVVYRRGLFYFEAFPAPAPSKKD